MKRVISYILIVLCFYSCEEKGMHEDLSFMIYKTQNDYFNNVPVYLNVNGDKIEGLPNRNVTNRYPQKLRNGYNLHSAITVNSGFISLTNGEYSNLDKVPIRDTLYKYLIDKNPFIEFYKTDYNGNGFYSDNGIDTVRINQIIANGELEMYFERLK